MFINTETILSIVQLVEMQTRTYQEFLKTFDQQEARIQTEILMKSLNAAAAAKPSEKRKI